MPKYHLFRHGNRTVDLHRLKDFPQQLTEGDLAEWLGCSTDRARHLRYEGNDWPGFERVCVDGVNLTVRYRRAAVREWAQGQPRVVAS